jgi:hypothetical protein
VSALANPNAMTAVSLRSSAAAPCSSAYPTFIVTWIDQILRRSPGSTPWSGWDDREGGGAMTVRWGMLSTAAIGRVP